MTAVPERARQGDTSGHADLNYSSFLKGVTPSVYERKQNHHLAHGYKAANVQQF